MNIRFLFVLALLSIFSCSNTDNWQSGDYFYLKNKGAVMPIWVVGNVDSDIFIITNHDGPGHVSGHDFHKSLGFQALEEKYAVVYWDQRMSGLSKGDPMYSDLTIDQHTEDLSKVITLINTRYRPKSLFMYGHGWGGGLAIDYLGKANNQKQFKGFISDGSMLQDSTDQIWKKEWILANAKSKLAETGDSKWSKMINWYNENPSPTITERKPLDFINELGGFYFDETYVREINNFSKNEALFNSPYAFAWKKNQYDNLDFIENYNFKSAAKNVYIPVLQINGINNGVASVASGEYIFNTLNTSKSNKYIFQIDKCAHYPYLEQPESWVAKISDFINAYK